MKPGIYVAYVGFRDVTVNRNSPGRLRFVFFLSQKEKGEEFWLTPFTRKVDAYASDYLKRTELKLK